MDEPEERSPDTIANLSRNWSAARACQNSSRQTATKNVRKRRDGSYQNPSRQTPEAPRKDVREETDFTRIHLLSGPTKSYQRRDGFYQNPSLLWPNQKLSEKRRILPESISSLAQPKVIREETDFTRIHLFSGPTKSYQRRDGFYQNPSLLWPNQKLSEKRRILPESISSLAQPKVIREETDFTRIHLFSGPTKSHQRRDGFYQNPSLLWPNQKLSEKRRILPEFISSLAQPKVIREETDFTRIHLFSGPTKSYQRRDGFYQNPSLLWPNQTLSEKRRILPESISSLAQPKVIREETDFTRIHLFSGPTKSYQRRDGFYQNPFSSLAQPKVIREETDFTKIHLFSGPPPNPL